MICKATLEYKNCKIANICYEERLTVCKLASDNKSMRFQYNCVEQRDSAGGDSEHAWGSTIQIFNGNVNAARSRDNILRFFVPSMCKHLPMETS